MNGQTIHAVVSQDGLPGVVVIARIGEAVVFVLQRRPCVDRELWELPRGFGEPQDFGKGKDGRRQVDAASAAGREFGEETGLTLVNRVHLGRIYPDTGLLSAEVDVVVGDVAGGPARETDGEVLAVRLIPRSRLRQ